MKLQFLKLIALSLLGLSVFSNAASPEIVLCKTIDSMGGDCGYDVKTKQVVAVITGANESAAELCSGISKLALRERLNFGFGWKLLVTKGMHSGSDQARCSL